MTKDPFTKLQKLLSEDMTDVTNLITKRMYSEYTPLIPIMTEHILNLTKLFIKKKKNGHRYFGKFED